MARGKVMRSVFFSTPCCSMMPAPARNCPVVARPSIKVRQVGGAPCDSGAHSLVQGEYRGAAAGLAAGFAPGAGFAAGGGFGGGPAFWARVGAAIAKATPNTAKGRTR